MELNLPNNLDPGLAAARQGSAEALGQALEACRAYLLGVANRELNDDLQAKVGASDLVQETFLHAQRGFRQFQGCTAEELRAWLRTILLHQIANVRRQYRKVAKRRVDLEVPLDPANSSGLPQWVAADTPSPSSRARRQEEVAALQAALDRLPEHYRQVLVWREWDKLPFEEIGRLTGRSADAVRMLWGRAVARLQREMGGTS